MGRLLFSNRTQPTDTISPGSKDIRRQLVVAAVVVVDCSAPDFEWRLVVLMIVVHDDDDGADGDGDDDAKTRTRI